MKGDLSMPIKVPERCLDCDEPSVSLGRCRYCYAKFRKDSPAEYEQLRSKSRAERAAIIRAQRLDAEMRPTAKRWEWQGDEAALAAKYGNENDRKTETEARSHS